jgi:Flp pilus assembly protein TadB
MLVLKNQAIFKKKAKGLVKFHCTQGTDAIDAVNKAIESGEAVVVTLKSVGTDALGDVVSEFEFEWSLKKKSK